MKRLLAGVLAWCWAALSMAHPVEQGQLDVQWQSQGVTLAVRVSDEQIMVASPRLSAQANSLEELWADAPKVDWEREL